VALLFGLWDHCCNHNGGVFCMYDSFIDITQVDVDVGVGERIIILPILSIHVLGVAHYCE